MRIMIASYFREIVVFINELPTTVGDIQRVIKALARVYVCERDIFVSSR